MLEKWQVEMLEALPGWREFCDGTHGSDKPQPNERTASVARMCKRIIEALGPTPAYITFKDEPFMAFMAEWQQWPGGLIKMLVGYFSMMNGDICYDPLVIVEMTDKGLSSRVVTWLGSAYPDTDLSYTEEFLSMVLDRHCEHFAAKESEVPNE